MPLRCVVGHPKNLREGKEIQVKFVKSAGARCWNGVYLRPVALPEDKPKAVTPKAKQRSDKLKQKSAKQKGKKQKSQKRATNDDQVR